MRKYILLAFLFITLSCMSKAFAQDYHCNKAWKKDWKGDKKEWKIRRKMFNDRPYKAQRKMNKSIKKNWKGDKKEYEHTHFHHYDHYWY